MKNSLWKIVQILTLGLLVFTCYNSVKQLSGNGKLYCSGWYCETSSDCGQGCWCNFRESTCYEGT
jgi:hypothetical protein